MKLQKDLKNMSIGKALSIEEGPERAKLEE